MEKRLTKNFSLWEFEYSSTAKARHIDNSIKDADIEDHLRELCEKILQPLRDAWGGSITITSGYRCPELNRAVGGSSTSAHLSGYAADLVPANGKISEFFRFAEDWLRNNKVAFDQCIRERNKRGSRWLHIGVRSNYGLQRKQFKSLVQ